MGTALVNAMAFFIWRQTGPHYLARLNPDAALRLSRHPPPPPARVCGLTKNEAEDLLDWLEATGRHRPTVRYILGEGFSVTFS